MKFTKEFLQEMEGETVEDRIIGVGRWSIHHARVFKHEGKFYATNYSVGATENQEEAPYEYSPDEIECEEVFPYERTVTVYKPAAAVAHQRPTRRAGARTSVSWGLRKLARTTARPHRVGA
jgi:hypothetical protein